MARKKSFTGQGSAARQFFSVLEADSMSETAEAEAGESRGCDVGSEQAQSPPSARGVQEMSARYKRNPAYIECRTKRVQLVIQPSLYEAAKASATEAGISMNEFFNRALAKAVGREQ